jgi:hypothetical protein
VIGPLEQLQTRWFSRARALEPYAPAAAEAFRTASAELRDAIAAAEESVTLREAHDIGGYSIDHLQRVVKSGRIANVGTKGRIRIRREDVPIKPGRAALRVDKAEHPLRASAVVTSIIERNKR